MNEDGRIRRLRPEALHFFDANFLILPAADLPTLKNVPLQSRWITETVLQEVLERLGPGAQEAVDAEFHTLGFHDLYAKDPRVCPVFYWYVLAMYNPATVGSDSFVDDLFESMLIKNTVTQADRDQYQEFRRQIANSQSRNPNGDPVLQGLERMAARMRKKARRSLQDKHPAYLRDIKSLGLILYHALSSRQNIVYHTSDGDPVILLLKWLDSMATWTTLTHAVLSRLTALDKQLILRGGSVDVVLDFAEFVREKSRLFFGFLNDRHKTKACRFTIKHWNQAERKLDEDVYVWFDDRVAAGLANSHGTLSCPWTINAELGNWLQIHYDWPPDEAHQGQLCVHVKRKRIINRTSTSITPSEHDRLCAYRQDDVNGRIHHWSQFL
ncbi:MAG: hypothetical protein WBP56_12895 [Polyangia bacterium]